MKTPNAHLRVYSTMPEKASGSGGPLNKIAKSQRSNMKNNCISVAQEYGYPVLLDDDPEWVAAVSAGS